MQEGTLVGSKTITEKTLESKPSRRSMFAGKSVSCSPVPFPSCCQPQTIVSGIGHVDLSTLSMSLMMLQGTCRRLLLAASCRYPCVLVSRFAFLKADTWLTSGR